MLDSEKEKREVMGRGEIIEIAKESGYRNLVLKGDMICGLMCFMYTWGVVIDIDRVGYAKRVCFENYAEAYGFLQDWDCVTVPVAGVDGVTKVIGF